MLHLIVMIFAVCAIFGIVWWALNQIPLPPPIRIVVIALMAITAIVLLLELVGGLGAGGFSLGSGRCF